MKAAIIHDFNGIDHIEIADIPQPKRASNQVEIAIHAAGVNPVDWKITEGLFKGRMDYFLPITLGWECAGVIADPGSSPFKLGEKVYTLFREEKLHNGTFAESICIDATQVCRMPQNLSFVEAAAIPLASLTAWQALVDTASIQAGQTILVHAGAGGVGTFAIQIGKLFGCHVITTASQKNHTYVSMLGADEIIDYTQTSTARYIEERYPKGVDCIFNTVGMDVLETSYPLVKKGGWLVSISGALNQREMEKHSLQGAFVFVTPNQKELAHITELIEEKKLTCPAIQHTFPLDKAAEALSLNRSRHVQGKLILTMREEKG